MDVQFLFANPGLARTRKSGTIRASSQPRKGESMSLGRKRKHRMPKRDKHGRFIKKKARRAKRRNPSQAKQLSEVKKKLAQLARAKYQAGRRGGVSARAKAASALAQKQKALEARLRKLEKSERVESLEEQLAALKGKKGKSVAKKRKPRKAGKKSSKKKSKKKKSGKKAKRGGRKSAKRVAAGKKAARTRKRNKAKKASQKKHNPSRRRKHRKSRKHSRRSSRRRRNPEGVGMKKIESYLGHDMKEVGGLLIGGAIFGTVNGLAAKIPVVNQVQAVLNRVPVIGASLPALLIGVAGHMLAEKQRIKPLEMVSEGLIAASIVSMGVSASQLVPFLSQKPAAQAGLLIAPRGAGDFGGLPELVRGRADFGGNPGQLGDIAIYRDNGMSGDWQMAGAEEQEQLG